MNNMGESGSPYRMPRWWKNVSLSWLLKKTANDEEMNGLWTHMIHFSENVIALMRSVMCCHDIMSNTFLKSFFNRTEGIFSLWRKVHWRTSFDAWKLSGGVSYWVFELVSLLVFEEDRENSYQAKIFKSIGSIFFRDENNVSLVNSSQVNFVSIKII
jgi:hypothetical protein